MRKSAKGKVCTGESTKMEGVNWNKFGNSVVRKGMQPIWQRCNRHPPLVSHHPRSADSVRPASVFTASYVPREDSCLFFQYRLFVSVLARYSFFFFSHPIRSIESVIGFVYGGDDPANEYDFFVPRNITGDHRSGC